VSVLSSDLVQFYREHTRSEELCRKSGGELVPVNHRFGCACDRVDGVGGTGGMSGIAGQSGKIIAYMESWWVLGAGIGGLPRSHSVCVGAQSQSVYRHDDFGGARAWL